jgi:hypothetical protein
LFLPASQTCVDEAVAERDLMNHEAKASQVIFATTPTTSKGEFAVTKNEIITKTLAEINRDREGVGSFERDPNEELDYEDLVIVMLREQLPDDDVNTCEDFEGLEPQCCDTCHRFYPHYDMYLEDLPTGGKAWLCCAVRAALLSSLDRTISRQKWKSFARAREISHDTSVPARQESESSAF